MPAISVEIKAEVENCSKAILPSKEEIENNSRAHSAKMRYATKTTED